VRAHSAATSDRRALLADGEGVPQLSVVPADLRIPIVEKDMRSADSLKRQWSQEQVARLSVLPAREGAHRWPALTLSEIVSPPP
jgi:hypothetical protein